jgi:predicted ATP-dependent endonuclease of OLD family
MALPQICALVGPNNTGKSNILLAIQRVLGREWVSVNAFDDEDVYGRDPAADIKISLAFEPALAYAKFRDVDPVEISKFSFEYTRYKVGEQKGERRLEQKCLTMFESYVIALDQRQEICSESNLILGKSLLPFHSVVQSSGLKIL